MISFKRARQWLRNRLFRLLNDRDEISNLGLRLWTRHPAVTDKMFFAMSRRYERAEADLATKYIRPEHRVLEIGAGVGFLACHNRRNLGVRDYAIVEANPRLIDLIAKNLELNGAADVPLINAAVAPADGTISFTLSDEFWASSTAHDDGEMIEVEAQTIASLRNRLSFSPDTLIIDIEGGEIGLPVEHFEGFSRIVMETHPQIVGATPNEAMLDRFAKAGFVLRDENDNVVFLERS